MSEEYGQRITFYDGYIDTDEQAVINMALDYVEKGSEIMISTQSMQGNSGVIEVVWRYPARLDLVPKGYSTKIVTV